MKVRIVRSPEGEVDGIQIDLFRVGLTYEVSSSLATVLVCEGYAEPVLDFIAQPLLPTHDRRRPA